jgi:hypothetical protein
MGQVSAGKDHLQSHAGSEYEIPKLFYSPHEWSSIYCIGRGVIGLQSESREETHADHDGEGENGVRELEEVAIIQMLPEGEREEELSEIV